MPILPVCPVFIVIEGPEGGATTEFGRAFARAFGRPMLNCPWDLRPTQRKEMDRSCEGSPLAEILFRASAIAGISEVIRGDLADGLPVVIDRYWPSATAGHHAMGWPCPLEDVAAQLPRADITFYLYPFQNPDLALDYRERLRHPLVGTVIPVALSAPVKFLAEQLIEMFAARVPSRWRDL